MAVNNAAIEITDFTLATAATLAGATVSTNNLTGTANNDMIIALQGNDTVNAGAGDDTIGVWNANACRERATT